MSNSEESEDDCDEESEYDSDLDSESSMYQLAERKETFVSLNIMILMEYAEGETLRSLIDNAKNYLDRRMIFILFDQLMRGL